MTETRNSLLAQIVVASGGEVRNPHNRNMLLEDWLLSVQNSACSVYLFSSANSDSLEIESFTGNLKVMIAAPSEAGINPAIIAGRQGDFVASADPVNEPTVIQYEIEASAITQIVSSTFNGIVYKYAKDNVWYDVSMGAPVPLPYLSGTQLFLLDSLTAGPGSTKSPVYYIAKTAKENNRLRYITARMLKGHAPDTETIISDDLGTSSSVTDSVYSPSQACVEVDGSEALEILTIGNGNYNWLTARLYFEKKVGGGSFSIVEPVVINNISTDGDAGDIGYIDITNPTPTESTAIRVSNFTGSVRFSLLRRLIEDVETDYLDVLNLAYSGQTTADYNLVTNISDWYTELGIEQAIVNTATNGSKIYSEHIIEFRKLMDDLASAGVTGQDVLIMRPNDNARKLGDLWEDIRDEYNTRFTSIVRIYGDLAEFQANNWMLPSDITHPNETFNAIQATQEYALNLVDLHDQIDLGVQANWITEFNNLMWIQYDSTVTVSGDFSMQLRVRMDNRQFYLWDNEGDNRNSCRINTDGSIRLEIDNVITDSAAGGVSQNSWHTLDIERSGTTLTVDCDGVEVMNATVSTLDILFTRTGRSAAAYLIRGAMAWFTVTGQHQWLFNQSPYDTVIPDLTGSTDAAWIGILDVKDNPLKLSVLPDGELLDYHYNVRTGVYWGDATWPTGA